MERVRRQRRLSVSDQRRVEHRLSNSDPPGCSCKQRLINGAIGVVQVVDPLSGMEKALGLSPAMHKPGVVVNTCNPRRIRSTMPSLATYFEASLDFMRGDRCGGICLQFQGQRQTVADSQPSLFGEIQASKKPFLKTYLRLCVSVRIHKVVLCPAHMYASECICTHLMNSNTYQHVSAHVMPHMSTIRNL